MVYRCPVCEGAGGWNARTGKPERHEPTREGDIPYSDDDWTRCVLCHGHGHVRDSETP